MCYGTFDSRKSFIVRSQFCCLYLNVVCRRILTLYRSILRLMFKYLEGISLVVFLTVDSSDMRIEAINTKEAELLVYQKNQKPFPCISFVFSFLCSPFWYLYDGWNESNHEYLDTQSLATPYWIPRQKIFILFEAEIYFYFLIVNGNWMKNWERFFYVLRVWDLVLGTQ